jgi:putative ABC transport system permease protein
MFKLFLNSSLRVTLRSMAKDVSYSITSVIGLSIGVLSCMLILLWVFDEFKVDRVSTGKKVAFVLANISQGPGQIDTWVTTPYILGSTLKDKYPSIEKSATVSWDRTFSFRRGGEIFETKGLFSTADFVDIFDLPVPLSSKESFAKKVNGIIVTESFADRYFGQQWTEKDLIGSELVTAANELFEIVAVIPDRRHSTLKFEVLAQYDYFIRSNPSLTGWDQYSSKTIVQIRGGYTFESANLNISHAISESGPDPEDNTQLMLQPFQETYLNGKYANGKSVGGKIEYIRILLLASAMTLFLSLINFVVLLTIRTSKRQKELSVKKMLGAAPITVASEFLIESIFVFALSFFIALGIAHLLIPGFNSFTMKSIDVRDLWGGPVFYLSCLMLVASVVSGFLPVYLQKISGDKLSITKSSKSHSSTGANLRRFMISLQYAITLVLLIGSIVISSQSNYFLTKDLGMDRNNVMIAKVGNTLTAMQRQTLKNKLLMLNDITAVSYTDSNPLEINNEESGFKWEGRDKFSDKEIYFSVLGADQDLLPVLGLKLADGRNYNANPLGDSANYLVNVTAAKAMGFDDPKEKRLNGGKIVGVVSDFHFKSLYSPIDPLIIKIEPKPAYILIRAKAGYSEQTLSLIKKEYQQMNPVQTLDVKFLTDEYTKTYKNELIVRDLIISFALISLVISSIGQLSLVTYTTEMKTKEIGIRKVLGATENSIIQRLCFEFIKLMIISLVFSIPVSFLFADSWLDTFAYRIDVNIWMYSIAVMFMFALTLLTVFRTTLRAARQNPTKSLRYE